MVFDSLTSVVTQRLAVVLPSASPLDSCPRIGVRGMLSYQSLVPAGAGTPRCEKTELWFGTVNWHGGFCYAPPPTPAGDKPPRYIFSFRPRRSVYNSARFAGGEPASRLIGGHIPDRESGTCFRTNRPCRLAPAHQGMESRSCGLVQRIGTVDSATPHPDPSGGQAPALHSLIPPSAIGLQFGTFRRGRAGIEVDWRAHPGSESGMCFRTNDDMRFAGLSKWAL